MPAKVRRGPDHRRDARTSGASEVVGLDRGYSKEKSNGGSSRLNHATFSVWAAALILGSVLVFGFHQIRGWLAGVQEAIQQVGQDNKLLLEGLDEILTRTDKQQGREAEAGSPSASLSRDTDLDKAEKDEPDDTARKYKIYYRSKQGEDLAQISTKFNVSVDQLRLWNALKESDSLIPGQVLVINKSTQPTETAEEASSPSYETESAVARQEPPAKEPASEQIASAAAAEEPPAAEPASEPPSQAGTKPAEPAEGLGAEESNPAEGAVDSLALEGEEAGAGPTEEPADAHAEEAVHVVREGESLSVIAQTYGVPWQALAKANNIAPSGIIFTGQRLKIPDVSKTEALRLSRGIILYKVGEGENLYRIGLAHDVAWEEIAVANQITDPARVYAGQVLKIPVAKGGPDLPADRSLTTESAEGIVTQKN